MQGRNKGRHLPLPASTSADETSSVHPLFLSFSTVHCAFHESRDFANVLMALLKVLAVTPKDEVVLRLEAVR